LRSAPSKLLAYDTRQRPPHHGFVQVFLWEVCPRQLLGFLSSGGQYTSKAPRKSVSGQSAAGAPCALSGNLWY
ncbi:MAG TPA: hypothetical protein VFC29_05620, partial [Candidatus Limnocylindrales bacterium]|nr:hypothetical protein [Candidatus Limnocylindrales bacterium]